jgi:hypothetical protein
MFGACGLFLLVVLVRLGLYLGFGAVGKVIVGMWKLKRYLLKSGRRHRTNTTHKAMTKIAVINMFLE